MFRQTNFAKWRVPFAAQISARHFPFSAIILHNFSSMDKFLSRQFLQFLLCILTVQANGVRWLVLDLHSFHVTQSCLTDICRNPTFKSTLKLGDSLLSSVIQINATATNGIYDRLVSAPIKTAHLDTFGVTTEIVGTDPSFNFPRICDSSPLEPISKFINHTVCV